MVGMSTELLFSGVVALVAIELVLLMIISRRNTRILLGSGGVVSDSSQRFGRLNTVLRVTWIVAMLIEVWFFQRPFIAWLAAIALFLTLLALALRVASMRALGPRWTLPSVGLPGVPPVRSGIYGYFRYPNWIGVVLEIVTIPLLHSAWVTAVVYLVVELLLLQQRARDESSLLEKCAAQKPSQAESQTASVGIIGAGAAGIATARGLRKQGVSFEVLERSGKIGGLWASQSDGPLASNTHIISPKNLQAFSDQKMPDDYPEFPHHRQVHTYLVDYAQQHDLTRSISLNADVVSVVRKENHWQVDLANGSERQYSDLVLASGYHSKPRLPAVDGEFSGCSYHSSDLIELSQLEDKRVLVVGAGQSAMDWLVNSAVTAKATYHSTRRPFICVPRYLAGYPIEYLLDNPPGPVRFMVSRWSLERMFKLTALLSRTVMRIAGHRGDNWGLPPQTTETVLPTMDQKVYAFYAQGDIQHRPNLQSFDGDWAVFTDGSRAEVDLVIFATGYEIEFPFIQRDALNWPSDAGIPDLQRHIFHPTDNSLFVVGLVHPIGSHWRVFERQAGLVARYLELKRRGLHDIVDSIWAERRDSREASVKSAWGLKVNKLGYLRELAEDLNGFRGLS